MGNSLVPLSPSRKFSARAALVDLQESSRGLLTECFRQFGIDTVPMSSEKAQRLSTEKFEACVIRVGGMPSQCWSRRANRNPTAAW